MARALVFGAGGQLGRELVRIVPGVVGLTHQQVSIIDPSNVMAAMALNTPDVVFNCAAYNAVDRAETETNVAFAVNAAGALNVAIACEHFGARLLHFSTNYVFDGASEVPYLESEAVHPAGIYARSKAEGESNVLSTLPSALVIRTAALYGTQGSAIKGGSFPERIVSSARSGKGLRVVSDQWVNPTYAADLARAAAGLAEGGMQGIVHVVAEGCCTWLEFALAALEALGLTAEIEAVTSEDLGAPAPRPRNGCLGSTRVSALRPWREALREWAGSRL